MENINLKYTLTSDEIDSYVEYIISSGNIKFKTKLGKKLTRKEFRKGIEASNDFDTNIRERDFQFNKTGEVIGFDEVIWVDDFQGLIIIACLNKPKRVIPMRVFTDENIKNEFLEMMTKVSEDNREKEKENPRVYDEEELILADDIITKRKYVMREIYSYTLNRNRERANKFLICFP